MAKAKKEEKIMKTTIKNLIAVAYDKFDTVIAGTNSVNSLGFLASHNYPQSWLTETNVSEACRAHSYKLNKEVPVF